MSGDQTDAAFESVPQRVYLSDMLDQRILVDLLRRRLSIDSHPPLMLVGPKGAGKKQVSRLYAQSVLCDAPISPDKPCYECAECKALSRGQMTFSFLMMNARVHRLDRHVRDQIARVRGGLDKRDVVVVDDAHWLTETGADILLKTLERSSRVTFVFLTSDIDAVRPALRSRCEVFEMEPVDHSSIVSLLESECRLRALQYEVEALRLIASEAQGIVGRALGSLERVIREGSVTLQLSWNVLDLNWGERMVDCWLAMLRDDPSAAYTISEGLRGNCLSRTVAMQEFVRAFYIRNILRMSDADVGLPLALSQLPDHRWSQVERAWREVAERLSMSLQRHVENALELWSAESGTGSWKAAFRRGCRVLTADRNQMVAGTHA